MNNPIEAATLDTGGDPVLGAIKWVALAVIAVVVAIKPLMLLIRSVKSDRVADAKDAAETKLYASLSEQLSSQKLQLDEVYRAHNALVIEHGRTLSRVSKVEEYEATIETLKQSLAAKDLLINDKDAEIQREREHSRVLTMEILQLKDRLGHLERRILEDETLYLRAQLGAKDAPHA